MCFDHPSVIQSTLSRSQIFDGDLVVLSLDSVANIAKTNEIWVNVEVNWSH